MKLTVAQANVIITVCTAILLVLLFLLPTNTGHVGIWEIGYSYGAQVDVHQTRLTIYLLGIVTVGAAVFAISLACQSSEQ